jgi:hypothetical protein
LLQQQKQYHQQQQLTQSQSTQNNSPNLSRLSSFSDLNKIETRPVPSSSGFDYFALHNPGNPGALNVLETLQSKLNLRDGEIAQLQVLNSFFQ